MISPPDEIVVGLISDTHGLLRPEVFAAFAGVSMILHAGDVGGDDILDELQTIAPVQAVAGNTDPPGNPRLVDARSLEIGGVRVHLSHGHEAGAPTPARLLARYPDDVLVYGHTHRQLVVRADGRWVVNPGAAGPRRFDIQAAVTLMRIRERTPTFQLIELGGS